MEKNSVASSFFSELITLTALLRPTLICYKKKQKKTNDCQTSSSQQKPTDYQTNKQTSKQPAGSWLALTLAPTRFDSCEIPANSPSFMEKETPYS